MRKTRALLLTLSSLAALNCAAPKPEAAHVAPAPGNVQQAAHNITSTNLQTMSGSSSAQTNAPDVLVKDLYKQHDADRSPFFQTKDRTRLDRYFVKSTADLIWKDATAGTGVLNADPLYDSHDPAPKNFTISQPKIDNDTATVVASFVNYGTKETVTFRLFKENSAWKISDIEYKDGRSLLKLFKEDFYRVDEREQESPPAAAAGEFEGRYRVGETTCTVKPIKMGFEVRWAKGTGAMIFFGEEGHRFVSEDAGKGSDSFVFDDDTLNSGTFIRADGKQTPVKRLE
jgi:hypothetical protein